MENEVKRWNRTPVLERKADVFYVGIRLVFICFQFSRDITISWHKQMARTFRRVGGDVTFVGSAGSADWLKLPRRGANFVGCSTIDDSIFSTRVCKVCKVCSCINTTTNSTTKTILSKNDRHRRFDMLNPKLSQVHFLRDEPKVCLTIVSSFGRSILPNGDQTTCEWRLSTFPL